MCHENRVEVHDNGNDHLCATDIWMTTGPEEREEAEACTADALSPAVAGELTLKNKK